MELSAAQKQAMLKDIRSDLYDECNYYLSVSDGDKKFPVPMLFDDVALVDHPARWVNRKRNVVLNYLYG